MFFVKMSFALAGIFSILTLGAKAETLVVAAPFKEFPVLASQMLDGATAALTGAWSVKSVDAGCSEPALAGMVDAIIAEKPDAVIGLPCIESLTPALAALGPIGIPIFTIASRADSPSVTARKNQWRLYRIGPRENQEREAIANLLVNTFQNVPFAILDDGTIFARDTAEAIRNAAETAGQKPVLVEGFQPQLETQKTLIDRLVKSGASHVFIASDRANIAQIAAEAEGLDLTIYGPESLRANDLDFPLPSGVMMAGRDLALNPQADATITSARQSAFERAEGYTADAFVAAEIMMALKANMSARDFDTAAGNLKMTDDGFIEPVNYALFRFNGATFEKVLP